MAAPEYVSLNKSASTLRRLALGTTRMSWVDVVGLTDGRRCHDVLPYHCTRPQRA